jgi:hypothetical protein
MTTESKPQTAADLTKTLLAKLERDPGDLAQVIRDLSTATERGGLIEPEGGAVWNTWGVVINFLLQKGLRHLAVDVALAWYDRAAELQEFGKRFHKGAPAYVSAIRLLDLGDFQRAFWFCTLAFIEDVLSDDQEHIPASAATQTLRVHFRQTDPALLAIASKAIEVKNTQPDLWVYPETTAVHLAREQKLFPPAKASGTDISINRQFLKRLIADLRKGGTDVKKRALEFLASYLAITLPGASVKPNVKAFAHGSAYEHEVDLVVTQYATFPSYLLEALGRHFLIECKNWEKCVGVSELNHFVAKMRFHRCKCGVIFSMKGLSGDEARDAGGLRFARLTQLRWYHQDECTVIVIDEAELNRISEGSMTFSQVLLRGFESVKFSTLNPD